MKSTIINNVINNYLHLLKGYNLNLLTRVFNDIGSNVDSLASNELREKKLKMVRLHDLRNIILFL